MGDSGAGNYSLPGGYLAVSGQTILASQHNPSLEDIAASLNRRPYRDGRAPFTGNQNFNGYRAVGAANAEDPQDFVTLSQLQALIAAIQGVPTGVMYPYTISSSTAPTGYIFANGASVSRTTYANLWAKVSAGNNLAASQGVKTAGQYGPGNGSSTFTLPDLYADSGYFIRAMGSGRTIGSVQADELKTHAHPATFSGDPVAAHRHDQAYTDSTSGPFADRVTRGRTGGTTGTADIGMDTAGGHTPSGDVTVSSTGGTETRPKNIAYPVIIKT